MSTLKPIEQIRQKLNNVYLRLAYGKSNIETAKKELDAILTQDRKDIHTSLVAAVEGKEKDSKKAKESQDGELIAAIIGYNHALDDTLTIINSIFKE